MAEFRNQYAKDSTQWNALFRWLQATDLQALPKGKHPIPGTSLTASVQDDVNRPLAERGSESHRKKVDFQFVVSGTEGFALLDHGASTKPNCAYNEKKDVIHYDYDASKAWVFATKAPHFNIFFPGDWHVSKAWVFATKAPHFNIFFPGDWHVAKVLTKKKDQHFRVIVVKMKYMD